MVLSMRSKTSLVIAIVVCSFLAIIGVGVALWHNYHQTQTDEQIVTNHAVYEVPFVYHVGLPDDSVTGIVTTGVSAIGYTGTITDDYVAAPLQDQQDNKPQPVTVHENDISENTAPQESIIHEDELDVFPELLEDDTTQEIADSGDQLDQDLYDAMTDELANF